MTATRILDDNALEGWARTEMHQESDLQLAAAEVVQQLFAIRAAEGVTCLDLDNYP